MATMALWQRLCLSTLVPYAETASSIAAEPSVIPAFLTLLTPALEPTACVSRARAAD